VCVCVSVCVCMYVCICVYVCVIKLDSLRQRIDEDMHAREASQDRRHIRERGEGERERWERGARRERYPFPLLQCDCCLVELSLSRTPSRHE